MSCTHIATSGHGQSATDDIKTRFWYNLKLNTHAKLGQTLSQFLFL